MENKKILAADARKIADTTDLILYRIYRVIGDTAKEGIVQLNWDIDNMSSTLLSSVYSQLLEDGYKLKYIYDEDENSSKIIALQINW